MVDLTGKTVIYGGSFDPPHMGHQMAVLYLLEALNAKSVWLVPTYTHPFGKKPLTFTHRLQMCTLLAAPFAERAEVCSAEEHLRGDGRTFDLLNYLQEQHAERNFALAIGADILSETHAWHRWDDICAMMEVAVIGRHGVPILGTASLVSAEFNIQLPAISSSEIRRRLGAGESIETMVPQTVVRYIHNNSLYASSAPKTPTAHQ